jgi:hypothetical protein
MDPARDVQPMTMRNGNAAAARRRDGERTLKSSEQGGYGQEVIG